MHVGIGLIAIVGLIAFAFGERAARTAVQIALLAMLGAFAYVMFRVVDGSI
jgi:hypothetical protein